MLHGRKAGQVHGNGTYRSIAAAALAVLIWFSPGLNYMSPCGFMRWKVYEMVGAWPPPYLHVTAYDDGIECNY